MAKNPKNFFSQITFLARCFAGDVENEQRTDIVLPEAYPFARRDDTVVDWFRIAKVILKILLILLIQIALILEHFPME